MKISNLAFYFFNSLINNLHSNSHFWQTYMLKYTLLILLLFIQINLDKTA